MEEFKIILSNAFAISSYNEGIAITFIGTYDTYNKMRTTAPTLANKIKIINNDRRLALFVPITVGISIEHDVTQDGILTIITLN